MPGVPQLDLSLVETPSNVLYQRLVELAGSNCDSDDPDDEDYAPSGRHGDTDTGSSPRPRGVTTNREVIEISSDGDDSSSNTDPAVAREIKRRRLYDSLEESSGGDSGGETDEE